MVSQLQKFVRCMAAVVAALVFCNDSCAQQTTAEERTPGGDLSAFFNPPGVPTTTTRTTRKIGSKKKKSDDKNPPASTASSPDAKDTPKPAATATTKSGNNGSASKTTASSDAKDASSKDEAADSDARVKMEAVNEDQTIEGGITFGPPTKTNWRVGVVMVTGTRPVSNVVCRIPVPTNWPEQTVEVFKEELPPEISRVKWLDVGNIKMLELKVGEFPSREKLLGLVTFTVSTRQIIAPKDTSRFRIPEKRIKEIRNYFGESPEISFRDSKLKKHARAMFDVEQSDWIKIEGLYDWVRSNIEERSMEPKGSVAAFHNKFGAAEDRAGLFVALCRASKVPARLVFYDGGQYAEFYLVDENDRGHWFPAKVSGIREFGEIGEPKVILQKGDNYRVPGEKKRLKFVPAKAQMQGSKPRQIMFVREPRPIDE